MSQIRCAGCMQPMGSGPICAHCGYDNRQQNGTHQLPVGTVLKGQYVIGKVLGQGGFGITYLGWDAHLGIPVAIKEYYPNGVVMRDSSRSLSVYNCEGSDSARFETDRQRFLREAQALARLGNIPEVVHVLGFFPENGTAYIIMEFIRGRTLKQYIQDRGPMPPEAVLTMFGPVFRGLEQVHGAGLIHRDISPDNIMLLPEGRVKLLDFGAVRSYKEEQQQSTESILKHGYAPLEQYQRRGTLGPWTDVYALCGTMYYCMTGKLPPDAPERMLYGEEYPWEEISGLQPHQLDTLKKGTAMLVNDRLPSVEELARGLRQQTLVPAEPVLPKLEEPAPTVKTEKKVTKAKPRRKHRGKITVLLLALVLMGIWLVWNRKPEDKAMEVPAETRGAAAEPTTQPEQTESTEPVQTEAAMEPEHLTRTITEDKIEYAAGDAVVTLENGKYLTATLAGLDLPERFPVDLQNDPEIPYMWGIRLFCENNSIELGTKYAVSIRSSWSGEITLEEMDTDLVLYNEPLFFSGDNQRQTAMFTGCAYREVPIEVSHDKHSITWKIDYSGIPGYILPDGKKTPFAFDIEKADRMWVIIVDETTGQETMEMYYLE